MSAFLLSFCTCHMRAGYTQRGNRNLKDEALTKRSKSDDTIELKVLLRCATESSDAGVSRLMLAITWVRRERTCSRTGVFRKRAHGPAEVPQVIGSAPTASDLPIDLVVQP